MEKHAFISYVREDGPKVDRIQRMLEAAGIPVWRDTKDLWPGENWQIKICQAIENDSLVFIACFSDRSAAREKTYQNEELLLAVEQLRLRHPGQPWLIPVRLSDCSLPAFDIGAGKTLDSLQQVDLFGDRGWTENSGRLIAGVQRILLRYPAPSPPLDTAPFYLEGELAQEPADLGRILSEQWAVARRVLARTTGEDKETCARLSTWLADHNQTRALRILNEYGSTDRRLVRLILTLAPNVPPRYNGHDLDADSLIQLARRAESGDTHAAKIVGEMYEFDILGSYPALAETNAEWRRLMASY